MDRSSDLVIAGFDAVIEDAEVGLAQLPQLFHGFHLDALDIRIGPDPFHPRQMLPDPLQDPHQPWLGNDQRVAVHQKEAVLVLHVSGGIEDVTQDDPVAVSYTHLTLPTIYS